MKKNLTFCGLITVVLIIGLGSGCKSSPKPLPELKADGGNALVYFMKASIGGSIGIWDGETPVGIIQDKEYIIHRVPAGTRYFIFDAAGIWRVIRAGLTAGKTYYVSFSTVEAFNMYYVTADAKSADDPDVEQMLKDNKRVGFDNEWKKAYSDGRVDKVKEELGKARNGSAEVLEIASGSGF